MTDTQHPNDAAIVTGASRGLGVGIARQLSLAGYPVVVAARSQRALDAVAATLPGPTLAVATDVSDAKQIGDLIHRTAAEFGGIEIVVNNAGAPPVLDAFDELTWDGWHHGIAVDVHGAFAMMQASRAAMKMRGGGTIVNVVAAAGGTVSSPAHICVSPNQAALASLSRCAATVLIDDGIVVHTLLPAITPTGSVGAIAAAVLGIQFDGPVLTADQMGAAVVRLHAERTPADWRVTPEGLERL